MARSGRLRRKADVQAPVTQENEHGEPVVTWVSVGMRWCGIEPLSQREIESAQEEHAHATHRIVMRQDSVTRAIEPKHRVVFGGHLYDIVGVAQVGGRDADLHLRATERVYDEI